MLVLTILLGKVGQCRATVNSQSGIKEESAKVLDKGILRNDRRAQPYEGERSDDRKKTGLLTIFVTCYKKAYELTIGV